MTGFAQLPNSHSKAKNGQLKTKTESKEVLKENPSRLCLILTNVGAKTITVGFGSSVEAEKGIVLTKEGPPFKIYGYTGPVFAISAESEPILAYAEF